MMTTTACTSGHSCEATKILKRHCGGTDLMKALAIREEAGGVRQWWHGLTMLVMGEEFYSGGCWRWSWGSA
jgi:hypothetical protein